MKPFDKVRVLEFGHMLTGPFCSYQLAVLGADVIKIEDPNAPDMCRAIGTDETLRARNVDTWFLAQNAGKRSIALDLNKAEDLTVARKLATMADVIVENYRVGALERFGLGYEQLRTENPVLIYCSITGYGRTGPKAQHPAYDNVIQAFSGVMSLTGTEETGPTKVGPYLIDYATGMHAAFAVASALFQRSRTGEGQAIDVSMLDATLLMMATDIVETQILGTSPPLRGNSTLYDARDGRLMIGAFTGKQYRRMWRVFGRSDISGALSAVTTQQLRDGVGKPYEPILKTIIRERSADARSPAERKWRPGSEIADTGRSPCASARSQPLIPAGLHCSWRHPFDMQNSVAGLRDVCIQHWASVATTAARSAPGRNYRRARVASKRFWGDSGSMERINRTENFFG